MDDKRLHSIIRACQRQLAHKPPLVSKHDWAWRRKRWLAASLRRLFFMALGRATFIKIKWRWCRGEIRERRLGFARLTAAIVPPIRRPIDYIGLVKKLFVVEDLPPGGYDAFI